MSIPSYPIMDFHSPLQTNHSVLLSHGQVAEIPPPPTRWTEMCRAAKHHSFTYVSTQLDMSINERTFHTFVSLYPTLHIGRAIHSKFCEASSHAAGPVLARIGAGRMGPSALPCSPRGAALEAKRPLSL